MKQISLFIFLLLITKLLFGQTEYQNEKYGFSGYTPNDWQIYAEITDDTINNLAIIDWGLPKVYSELEDSFIENAIAIIAYKKQEIKNIDDLIKFELNRISDIFVSKEVIDSSTYIAYNIITVINGLKYKSKVVFAFQNSVGYAINFTATPETYDVNILKFEDFLKNIKFYKPKEKLQYSEPSKIRFDGLYTAKTGVINIPNNKMDIYTYLRFYDDGTVYTQAVTSFSPKKVANWLGENGRFERKGKYNIEGADINFIVTNDESSDKEIEGAKTDVYYGRITDDNKLYLQINYNNGEHKEYWFKFTAVE